MLVAFSDHVVGNSTPSCSKATEPSFQFEIRASRFSHSTWSYGCTPAVVKCRLMPMARRSGARDMSGPFLVWRSGVGSGVGRLKKRVQESTRCGVCGPPARVPPQVVVRLQQCNYDHVNDCSRSPCIRAFSRWSRLYESSKRRSTGVVPSRRFRSNSCPIQLPIRRSPRPSGRPDRPGNSTSRVSSPRSGNHPCVTPSPYGRPPVGRKWTTV